MICFPSDFFDELRSTQLVDSLLFLFWLSFPSWLISRDSSHISREQGWRSGESARFPPMLPGFDSRTRRHMWVEFVVGSCPCSEGFSPGSPVFLPPQKPTLPNSNSIGNSRATGLSVARLLGATLVKHS